MIENEKSDAEKRDGVNGVEGALTAIQVEGPPFNRPHRQNMPDGTADGRHNGKEDTRRFPSRLTFNEWLTFLIGVGSLVVSCLTYKNAADTSDLKSAVVNLTSLAGDARRQADAMQAEAKAMQGQLVQMETAQRAWLLVDDLSVGNIEQFPAGAGIVAFAKYRITNLGHSPATGIFINTALVFKGLDQFDADSIRRICMARPSEDERTLAEYSGIILPGRTQVIDGIGEGASFSHAIDSIESERDAQNREAQNIGQKLGFRVPGKPAKGWGSLFIDPTLAGCVTYKVGGSDALHETGFAFNAHNGILNIPVEVGQKGEVFSGPLQITSSAVGNFAN